MIPGPDPDDERLLGLIRKSISAPPRWDQHGEPLTAESVRKAMDDYWTRQPEMRTVVSPNLYRALFETPATPTSDPVDLEALAAQVRAAMDEHTLFVPQDAFREAKALEEEYARLRVVCVPSMEPGRAYLVNDSEVERHLREAAERVLTITSLPDTDDDTFRYRAEWEGQHVSPGKPQ